MRVFVYINFPTGYITIHCEKSRICPHIMKQIMSRNTVPDCLIEDVSISNDKSIIQLGRTSNGYWFLVYTNSCECEEIRSEIEQKLRTIMQNGIFKICDKCS